MERWSNKVAVVTGASAGIGAQIAVDLAAAGMQVIGLARRIERVEQLRERLPALRRDALHPRQCDVSRPADVRAAFVWIAANFGGCAHVLVNCAGISSYGSLLAPAGQSMAAAATVPAAEDADLLAVIETNLLGTVHCMREAVRLLDAQSGESGHIVNVNSLSGHRINRSDALVATMNVYPASKHGMTAATECVRRELNLRGNRNVRISVRRYDRKMYSL